MSKVRRYEVTAAGDFASVLAVLTDHLGLRLLSLDEGERSWLDTPAGTLGRLLRLGHVDPEMRGNLAPDHFGFGQGRAR